MPISSEPERASRAVHRLRDRPNRALIHVDIGVIAAQTPCQCQPLFAVIVAVWQQMLVQKHTRVTAHLTGEEEHDKQQHGRDREQQRRHFGPTAVEAADIGTATGHDHQIGAGHDQGASAKDHLIGNTQSRRPLGIARRGQPDQRHHQCIDSTSCVPDRQRNAMSDQRSRIHHEVIGEQRCQRQAQVFHGPTRIQPTATVCLLDKHQAIEAHRDRAHGEQHAVAGRGGPRRAG